jgi:hypothetical protein
VSHATTTANHQVAPRRSHTTTTVNHQIASPMDPHNDDERDAGDDAQEVFNVLL